MYLLILLPGWCDRGIEIRESIIANLRRLGVQVNQILTYRPTDQQLNEMRDGLLRPNKRSRVSRN
jgi:hypothetical protein